MVAPQGRPGGTPGQIPANAQAMATKAPSAIKTNIKSATQIHPYGR
jgi:mediator of RNA polymerase II transcription subunit 8